MARRIRTRALASALICLAIAACAHKLPEPSGSQAEPHVTWAIGAGAESGDELHVCESAARSTCELGASSAAMPVRASVHLHMHAGDSGSVFTGEIRATFLSDDASGPTKVNSVVLAKRETNFRIGGVVVDKPGRYEFSYKLTASGVSGTKTLEARVPVVIR